MSNGYEVGQRCFVASLGDSLVIWRGTTAEQACKWGQPMRIVIPVELALYGFLLGSLALAWYTSTWLTWTYAIACLITAMVIVVRLLWQVVAGSWPDL